MSINILPDDVLLEVFDWCRIDGDPDQHPFDPVWKWHRLVHVCRRWRQIVFGSPLRLDLQILCTNGTPVRNLYCWPPFPITIQYSYHETFTLHDEDGLFAALEHPGRIRRIDLCLSGPWLREVALMMGDPFPALTHLILGWKNMRPPALPSGFLGGSAPCLQFMYLDGILFPELPALLSSTSDLVDLILDNIPEGGHIPPEEMVACLAALPRLKFLSIASQCAPIHLDQIPPPPVTRILLPALTSFEFQGANQYLEDLVSRIDSPRLSQIDLTYLHQNFHVKFQVVQLFEFIDRSKDPEISVIRHVDVNFSDLGVTFDIYPCPESHPDGDGVSALIYCQGIERHFRLAQVFSQPSALLSRVVHLKLSRCPDNASHLDDDDKWVHLFWLHLFCQFSTVRTLYVSRKFARDIILALEGVTGEAVAEVLPSLDLIYLEGQSVSFVEKFLTARRLSGRPVAIVDTEAEFDERVKSYVSQ